MGGVDVVGRWAAAASFDHRPRTVRTWRYWISRWLEEGGIEGSTSQLREWLGTLASPETRKSARSALRSFYRWAIAEGWCSSDPTAGLPPVRVPPALPRPASESELIRALSTAPDDRTRLALYLAAFAGLRRSEIVKVTAEDLYADVLVVRGKGGRDRMIPLPEWLADLVRRSGPGHVIRSVHGGPISPDHLYKLMRRCGVSPHRLRHRFATRAYAGSRDLRAVQLLLGHSRPETTARYTAISDDALRRAVAAAS